jgi:hypothetical protein
MLNLRVDLIDDGVLQPCSAETESDSGKAGTAVLVSIHIRRPQLILVNATDDDSSTDRSDDDDLHQSLLDRDEEISQAVQAPARFPRSSIPFVSRWLR